MAVVLPQSFRDERWAVFVRDLQQWLETPQGRFAAFCAQRDRRDDDRSATVDRRLCSHGRRR